MITATWKSGFCFLIQVSTIILATSCTFSKDKQKISGDPSTLPPNETEIVELKSGESWESTIKQSSLNKKWWLQFHWSHIYLQDQTQIPTACKLLEDLFQDRKFPLNTYSGLLLKTRCPGKSEIEVPLTDRQKTIYRKWTKEIELTKAITDSDQETKLILLLELNAEEKDRQTKKQTYFKILDEAKRLNIDKLVNLANYELKREFPQYLPDILKNKYDISLDLIKDRSFGDAISQLNTLIKSKEVKADLKFKSFKTIFRIYKSTQNKQDQWTLIERWSKWVKAQRKHPDHDSWSNETDILKARWLWTDSQTNKAIDILEAFRKKKISNSLKEEASYTLGRIYDERKDYEKAKLLYRQSHDQSSMKKDPLIKSKNSLFEKNLWSLAWLEYKNRKYEDAKNSLQEITDKLGGESDSKYLYWLAQANLKLGKEDVYKEVLLNLRKKEPLSFYSLLSYRDLEEPIPILKSPL